MVITSGVAATLKEIRAVAVLRFESVTVAEIVKLPGVSGVPFNTPAGVALIPDGNPVIDQVNGATPPVATSDAVYGVPATPSGSDAVVMVSAAGTILTLNVAAVAVR